MKQNTDDMPRQFFLMRHTLQINHCHDVLLYLLSPNKPPKILNPCNM